MRTAWSPVPVPVSRSSCQTTRTGHHGTLTEPWPKAPAPASQHADGQQPDEDSQHAQEDECHPSRRVGWEAEAEYLVVDLWGRCQDYDQAGQHHEEEAEDQRLSPVDHHSARLTAIRSCLAPVGTASQCQGQIGSSTTAETLTA